MSNSLNLSLVEHMECIKMKEQIEKSIPKYIHNVGDTVRLFKGNSEYLGHICKLNGDGTYGVQHSGHIIEKSTRVENIKKYISCGECTICFDDMVSGVHEIAYLCCEHIYHYKCLLKWYANPNANYSCPLCNVPRNVDNIYPLDSFKRVKKNKQCSII